MIDHDFASIVNQIQKKIEREEEKKYSKIVINEYRNPTNFGFITHPDSIAILKGPCGDTVNITLTIKNEIVHNARFWTDGCGATLAAGNMITKMARGKTLNQANKINSIQIIDALGGLPKEHTHCALLAVTTLHAAIKNYKKK
jgi:nitrogen fixation protein NifU and related proteins